MKTSIARILVLFVIGCSSQSDGGDATGGSSGSGGRGTGGSMSTGTGGSNGSGGSPGSGGGSGGSGAGGSASGGGGGASTGGSGAGGSGGAGDAASGQDTGTPGGTGGSPGGTAACGTTPASFNLTAFGRTEGLVIAPDGTVFMSDFGPHVMRHAPPYDKPEKTWATVAGATILGITYDPKKKVVYAGSRGADKMLYKIDAADPTKVEPIVAVEGGFNGMTLAEDGSIFYTDQGGGTVYRVTPDDKMKTMVAKVPDANGVAFGPAPDRKLYVLTYGNGNITEIVLENNVGKSQQLFVKLPKGSADGIAFDKMGNLYATAGALWKVAPDKTTTMVNPAGGANVEFGVGALSCKLVVWASTPPKQMEIDVEGMDVPWHRP